MSASNRRDYYEVLEIDQRASEDDIRKAYKKMSLRWHPDKNINNKEEADMRFKELQHAYSVLSDPMERQWYDDHKDAILRGVDPTAEDSEEEDIVNIWPYFNTSCFEGFRNGDPKSFWAVYQEAFDLVTEHEGGGTKPPRFGDSTTPWAEVSTFYSYWTGFSTRRRFGHKDKYNPNLAECRGDRRAITQENKRLRDKAKREYTALVRNLAVFVKKRDKRVLEFLASKRRAEEEERKARVEKDRLRDQLFKQQREEYLRQQAEEEDDPDHQEAANYIDNVLRNDATNRRRRKQQQSDSEDEYVEYHCPCCDKTFRSEKQMVEHERSKKHIQAAKRYLQEIAKQQTAQKAEEQAEEEEEDDDDEDDGDGKDQPQKEDEEDQEEDEEDGCIRAADVMNGMGVQEGSGEEEESDEEDSEDSDRSSSSQGSREVEEVPKKQAKEKSSSDTQEDSEDDRHRSVQPTRKKKNKGKDRRVVSDSDDGLAAPPAPKGQAADVPRSSHAKKKAKQREYEERKRQQQREEEERKAKEREAAAKKAKPAAKPKPKPKAQPEAAVADAEGVGDEAAPAAGKAAPTAEAPAPTVPSSSSDEGEARDYQYYEKKKREKQFLAEAMTPLTCSVCQRCFESRSKLFRHIQEAGHAALKTDTGKRGKRK
eukprot:GGOE01002407.1.p1 GENE.GGOE01002407.1~~GGOE01002407.1.p1  ORF type:complete len:651 (-),score=199.15 GGOE01002407.1:17-1969(-)